MSSFRTVLFVLLLFVAAPVAGQDEAVVEAVDAFLVLGPVPVRLPVFHDVESIRGETYGMDELLAYRHVEHDGWWPEVGGEVPWSDERTLTWRTLRTRRDTTVRLEAPDAGQPAVAYLAAYVEAERYVTPTLRLESTHLAEVFVDGASVATKTAAGADEATAELQLEPGTHRLLVKLVRDPDAEAPWTAGAVLTFDEPEDAEAVAASTDPTRRMGLDLLLDTPQASSLALSPDGELAALTLKQVDPETGESRSWLELRRADDGRLVQSSRGGMALADVQWAPTGRRFSYTSSDDGARTIWTVNLETGATTAVLEDVEDLGGYTWSPDGETIFYDVTESAEEDETGLTRLEGMADRWPWYRTRSSIYQVHVPEGTRRRLTSGLLSSSLEAVRPDGGQIVFTHEEPDYSERPYMRQTVMLLDVETLALDTLWSSPWSAGDVAWSPDGQTLLVLAGPEAFGGLGINLPQGTAIPNDYDTQAYLYDLDTRTAAPLTRDFDPAISQGAWSADGEAIYFGVTEGSYQRLYRFDVGERAYEPVPTGTEVMGTFDLALEAPRMIYAGSGAAQPHRVYTLDLASGQADVLADPAGTDYEHVAFGRVEPWSFTNERGVEIQGRVYYPPGFDPEETYPAIVYYYGGTAVVDRAFGGRYPKNLYAADGYVVYVLQPSGAPGYGQAFSALHVNDWGEIVADEIIDGVGQFLDAHPFVDRDRVGAMGASYGGFMTMLLMTKTDLFGAAIAHAGISSISSYWGEGYWGYLYSAVATANSFPWNRPDLYVEQSPLFRADRIETPLLLLHGTADTNVPVGESLQLYTALKLLGREVELVQVAGQDHHILDYEKRRRWTKTILAWFDRELKGEPAWWEALYPAVTE